MPTTISAPKASPAASFQNTRPLKQRFAITRYPSGIPHYLTDHPSFGEGIPPHPPMPTLGWTTDPGRATTFVDIDVAASRARTIGELHPALLTAGPVWIESV